MKAEIKRIDILPVLRIVFFFSLIFGFMIGLLYALAFSFFSQFGGMFEEIEGGAVGMLGSIGIILSTIFFVTSFNLAAALLFTALYNVTASLFGGIIINLDTEKQNLTAE